MSIKKRFEGITIEFVPHSKFDQLVPKAKGIIRTDNMVCMHPISYFSLAAPMTDKDE